MAPVSWIALGIVVGLALIALLLLLLSLAKVAAKPTPPITPADRFREADGTDVWWDRSHGGSDDE